MFCFVLFFYFAHVRPSERKKERERVKGREVKKNIQLNWMEHIEHSQRMKQAISQWPVAPTK